MTYTLTCNKNYLTLIQQSVFKTIYDEVPCLPSEEYLNKYSEVADKMLEYKYFISHIEKRFYDIAYNFTGMDLQYYSRVNIDIDKQSLNPVVVHHLDQAIIKFFYKGLKIDLVFDNKNNFNYLKLLNDESINTYFEKFFK